MAGFRRLLVSQDSCLRKNGQESVVSRILRTDNVRYLAHAGMKTCDKTHKSRLKNIDSFNTYIYIDNNPGNKLTDNLRLHNETYRKEISREGDHEHDDYRNL